jgi:hypothetical protein
MATTHLKGRDGTSVVLQTRLDERTERPVVSAGEQSYTTLADLLAAHPEIAAADQLPLYCELCLHFYPGPGCMLIEDPEEFRSRYQALVRYGTENPGDMPSTADFGPFDVSEISHPKLVQDLLVFYAEDMLYSLPYRVEVTWPYRNEEPVKFLLLPLQE